MKKNYFLTLLFGLMFLGLNAQNSADLDPTFGDNGVLTLTNLGTPSMANDVAIQPDGKIIIVGEAKPSSFSFTVIRLNNDGSFDSSFGTNGVVQSSHASGARGRGVALQSDGKIVVCGSSWAGGSNYSALVVRYNANGTIDNTFGVNGFAHLTGLYNSKRVAIQGDGKIVIGGFSSNDNYGLARLNSDGTLDVSFGSNGYVITQMEDTNGTNVASYVEDIALQNDGKVVAVGFAVCGETANDFVIARYNSDGTLDNTFNGTGIIIEDLGTCADFAISVKIQSDNKIVVGGHKETQLIVGVPDYDLAVIRLNPDGTKDTSFGTNGYTYVNAGVEASYNNDIAIQDDGKILYAGQGANYSTNKYDMLVGRLNSDGSIDNSFGENGYMLYNPTNNESHTSSMAIDNDGKIVIVGKSPIELGGLFHFRVMRLMGEAEGEAIPEVYVTINNIAATTFDINFIPNAFCQSYTFVAMTAAEVAQWLPVMGNMPNIIKAFGISKTGAYTHNYTGMIPNTEYFVYTLCIDNDGVEAQYDSVSVHTTTLGGGGVATAEVGVYEVTDTTAKTVVTPNIETSEFHYGIMTKEYFEEIGEEAAIDYFKNDNEPYYETHIWTWYTLEAETDYKVVAVCKNASDEWGPATIVDFRTKPVSIDEFDFSTILVYPNPSSGLFTIQLDNQYEVTVTNMQGSVVYSKTVSGMEQINLSGLSSGMYIINAKLANKVLRQNIIIR
ncbi:MAG TPA: T9SS type A sorting domain-containing protein [Salinivirgaceae bacterium]|nr:T9SS type A sorting domain-containing protein [Salinivirgaceae bacterium]